MCYNLSNNFGKEIIMDKERLDYLIDQARIIRNTTIEMIGTLGVGHIGGCMSIIEVLTAIYYETANVDPKNPQKPDRDRVVLSKGHAGPALYSTLAEKGFFDRSWIYTLNKPGTNLPSHADKNRTPGIDMTAGSLGQGISAAVGMAMAAKMDKNPCNVYAIIGDGESQEGQVWEALMLAGSKKLNNLIVFIDNNKMQIDGTVEEVNGIEDLEAKFNAFRFNTVSVDGHDIEQIVDAINNAKKQTDKPNMIILNTIKGKGFPEGEGKVSCHNMNMTEEVWKKAIEANNRR